VGQQRAEQVSVKTEWRNEVGNSKMKEKNEENKG
jgi:hypothetical protein